jgi:hypothetical protein
LFPRDEALLTDERLGDSSLEQIEVLVQRINAELRERGVGHLAWQRMPSGAPGGPPGEAGPGGAEDRPAAGTSGEARRRIPEREPWWRRWFGG